MAKSCRWQYEPIIIRLAVIGSQICEIPLNSERIRTYGKSRSSKVIGLAVNQKHICDFLLVIYSNFGHISYRFRNVESLKMACFSPTPPLFGALAGVEPVRISGWNLLAKSRWMWLRYGENFIIETSTVFDWSTRVTDRQTDWRTDRWAIAYSSLSIMLYAVAR